MPIATENSNAWIFVSHASSDLKAVRKVRNYLEDKGAAPLLFHLKALEDPEDFWPIIQREIEARNFFLYCDSPAAKASPWVQREKEAVERLRDHKPIRVEQIDVSSGDMDLDTLDALVRKTQVFVHHNVPFRHMIEPFEAYMRKAGFRVADISPRRFLTDDRFSSGVSVDELLKKRFIVYFCYNGMDSQRSWLDDQISLQSKLDQTVFVFMDEPSFDHPGLSARRVVRAWENPGRAPNRLIQVMMSN